MNYQVMPDLSEADFEALKSDIAERGVLVPVEYDEDGNVLDGHHRLRACEALGIKEWPRFIRKGLSEAEKITHARQLNIARRHLNQEQKRELILGQLIDTPEKSNRQIANGLGLSHHTVANVRGEGERRGQIAHVSETVDTLGRSQPRNKPIRTEYSITADKKAHVANNSGNSEWYTPSVYIDAARIVLGEIELDPASSEIANKTVGARRYFTEEQDGLSLSWDAETIWMNPPYAQPLIDRFCDKLALAVSSPRVSAIVLVNNATETRWFQRLCETASAICFPKGRIKFYGPDDEIATPLQGQALIYCGPNPDRFRNAFCEFGLVVAI